MSGTISLLPIYAFMRRQGKLPFRSEYPILHFYPNLAKIRFFLKNLLFVEIRCMFLNSIKFALQIIGNYDEVAQVH